MDDADAQRAAIRHTISALAAGLITQVEAFAAITSAVAAPADQTPRESAAAARQSRRERMLADYYRLQPTLGRATATRVARKHANDPLDPVEVESLARLLRGWLKKNGCFPFAGLKSE
jgi:hypothetical protein